MTRCYDDKQAEAQRITCAGCGRTFDMTHPDAFCLTCRRTSGVYDSNGRPRMEVRRRAADGGHQAIVDGPIQDDHDGRSDLRVAHAGTIRDRGIVSRRPEVAEAPSHS